LVISFAGILNGIGNKTKCYVTKGKTMSAKIPPAAMTLKQVLWKCGFFIAGAVLGYVAIHDIPVVESYIHTVLLVLFVGVGIPPPGVEIKTA
jgi:uncharacterized membrane protein YbjE (DUF340 family)